MNSPWLVVLNPISGQGRAMHHRHEIEAVLRRHGIDFALEISERPGHAIEIVSGAIRSGCRHVLAVGGDGTVNECANGIFRQDAVATTEITLGVMPIGTGNDWARTHRIPKDYAEVAALMAAGTSRLHDVGLAEFDDGGKSHLRYFINVAGIGFDAHVVESLPDRTLGLTRLAAGLNATGTVSYAQLHHAGNRAAADVTGIQAVCPSDDPATGARAMTGAEVEAAVEAFVAGAVRAQQAGGHRQGRGLAGAVGPDEAHDLAPLHPEGEAVEGPDAPEGPGQSGGLDHRAPVNRGTSAAAWRPR